MAVDHDILCVTCQGGTPVDASVNLLHVDNLQADFLTADTAAPEFADVQAVLLDPSCSGSGTAHSRMDFLLPSQWQSQALPADEVGNAKGNMQQLVHIAVCCLADRN
jgi:hypothetical protein